MNAHMHGATLGADMAQCLENQQNMIEMLKNIQGKLAEFDVQADDPVEAKQPLVDPATIISYMNAANARDIPFGLETSSKKAREKAQLAKLCDADENKML
jgi:hypothetical protein